MSWQVTSERETKSMTENSLSKVKNALKRFAVANLKTLKKMKSLI